MPKSIHYIEGRFIDNNIEEEFMRLIEYDADTGEIILKIESPYSRGDCTKGQFEFIYEYEGGYRMF